MMTARRLARLGSGLSVVALLITLGVLGACSKKAKPIAPEVDPGATVSGVVRDSASSPIGGARVTLADAPTPAGPSHAHGERTTTTDSTTGAFTFTGVPDGHYRLTIEAFRYVSESRDVHVAQGQEGGPLEPVDVTMGPAPAGTFVGQVTLDRATDHRNTLITLEESPLVVTTDPAGRFTLPVVPLGTWNISASHHGYHDTTITATLTQENETVQLPALVLLRNVNQPPTAGLTVEGFCPYAPTTLRAVDPRDPDGAISGYQWDFENDGIIDVAGPTLTQVMHTYEPGTHVARLVMIDDEGAHGDVTRGFIIPSTDTLYVSAPTGSAGGNGTRQAPLATLTAALARPRGQCPSRVIMATVGYYAENIWTGSNKSKLKLVGGLDPRTWTRAPHAFSVLAPPSPTEQTYWSEIADVQVSGFEFRGNEVSYPASIALTIRNSGTSLQFSDCRFIAGKGGRGNPGRDGTDGRFGETGNNGQGGAGGGGGAFHARGGDGGAGGTASRTSWNPEAIRGKPGQNGSGGAGGVGGVGVGCFDGATPGSDGMPGTAGWTGANGSGQTSFGDIVDSYWEPSRFWQPSRGVDGGFGGGGTGGGGGGGGGAAGGPSCPEGPGQGGGGGGGGGGGEGGVRGTGGGAGGASIAVLVLNSSAEFNGCFFSSDSGGAGASGGSGGRGGFAGPGGIGGGADGTGTTMGKVGGKGGAGGAGGAGGGGQGGPGGPSWCVARFNSNPTFTQCVFQPGVGGTPGLGGFRGGTTDQAAAGPPGPSGAFGP